MTSPRPSTAPVFGRPAPALLAVPAPSRVRRVGEDVETLLLMTLRAVPALSLVALVAWKAVAGA